MTFYITPFVRQGMELYLQLSGSFDVEVFTCAYVSPCGPKSASLEWMSCIFILSDLLQGMELYPRLGKNFDIKVFTNCRFGLMAWAVLCLNYGLVQVERDGQVADSMAVSVALTLIYVTKFFLWEAGYWCTMDIAHDRG